MTSTGTTLRQLQTHLLATGRYHGSLDGLWGPQTRDAVLLALSDGPDTPLSSQDIAQAARSRDLDPAAVQAVATVEASSAGFRAGKPLLLFEPHRFSRATSHRFDQTHPNISYPRWGSRPYPRSQEARYDQLLAAVRLDVDAGFASASYGRFQILGENHLAAGYSTPHDMAFAYARDELTQLRSFLAFLENASLLAPLRALDWTAFARGYNGPAFAANKYDQRLAAAYRKFSAAEGVVR